MRYFFCVFWITVACTAEVGENIDVEPAEDLVDSEPVEDVIEVEPVEDLVDAGSISELEPVDAIDEPVERDVTLDIDSWDKGGYPNTGPWVSIAYENSEHKSSILDASRLALLAYTLLQVWEEQELPNLEAVTERFSRFHVFAIASDETFARFKLPDLYAANPTAALEQMGTSGAFCYAHGNARYTDVPDKARFFFVIKGEFLTHLWGRETALHEMTHAALEAGFGDADPNHEFDDMWLPRSGFDNGSFMAMVLDDYP